MLNVMMALALASEPLPESAPTDDRPEFGTHPGACHDYEVEDGCRTLFWNGPGAPSSTCVCPDLVVIQGPWRSCEAVGDGHYACPDADSLVVPAQRGEEVTMHVYAPEAASGDGWECEDGWCSFDYGLADDDDVVEAPPGASGGGCEPQPGPTPPAPPRREPILVDVEPESCPGGTSAPGSC
jgi:hypothetical protein